MSKSVRNDIYIKRPVDLVSQANRIVDCVQLYILTKNRGDRDIVMPPKKKHGQITQMPEPTDIALKGYADPETPGFHCTCEIEDCGGDKCKCTMYGDKCRPTCNCAMKCKNS